MTTGWKPGDLLMRRRIDLFPRLYPEIGPACALRPLHSPLLPTDCVLVLGSPPSGSGWHRYVYVITVGRVAQLGWVLATGFERAQ